jgi:hypothetical protein
MHQGEAIYNTNTNLKDDIFPSIHVALISSEAIYMWNTYQMLENGDVLAIKSAQYCNLAGFP